MNDTSVDYSYEQAVESLKELNNQLFYSDLTNTLKEHSEQIGESYKQTTTSLEQMARIIHRLPQTFEEEVNSITEEFINNSNELLDNVTSQLEETIKNREESLKNISTDFAALQNEYSDLKNAFKNQQENYIEKLTQVMEDEKEVWNTYRSDLKDNINIWEEKHSKSLEKGILILGGRLTSMLDHIDVKVENLKLDHEKNMEAFYRSICGRLESVQKMQQEANNSLEIRAAEMNLSQQKHIEDRFLELKNVCVSIQEESQKKNKLSIKFLIGLAVANAVIISGQVIHFFTN